MSYHFTLIPGDGIGPEVTAATTRAIAATGVEIQWRPVSTGMEAVNLHGTPLPDETLAAIAESSPELLKLPPDS